MPVSCLHRTIRGWDTGHGLGTPDASGALEVFLDQNTPVGGATGARFDQAGQPTGEVLPTFRDLVNALGSATRLVVRDQTGRLTELIGSWHEYRETGANTKWVAFAPAGMPRDT